MGGAFVLLILIVLLLVGFEACVKVRLCVILIVPFLIHLCYFAYFTLPLCYFSHDDYIVSIPPCNGQYNGFR